MSRQGRKRPDSAAAASVSYDSEDDFVDPKGKSKAGRCNNDKGTPTPLKNKGTSSESYKRQKTGDGPSRTQRANNLQAAKGVPNERVSPNEDASSQLKDQLALLNDKIEKMQDNILEKIAGLDGRVQATEAALLKKFEQLEDVSCKHTEELGQVTHEQRDVKVMCEGLEQKLDLATLQLDRLNKIIKKDNQHPECRVPPHPAQPSEEVSAPTEAGSRSVGGSRQPEGGSPPADHQKEESVQEVKSSKKVTPISTRRGNRNRKPGPQEKTPFTKLAKTKVVQNKNIPPAPKHNTLTTRQRNSLYNWLSNTSVRNAEVRGINGKYQKDWFYWILEWDCWLEDEKVEEMLSHICKGIYKYPQRFEKVVVLHSWFTRRFSVELMEKFVHVGKSAFRFEEVWFKFSRGELPIEYGKSLAAVEKFYAPFNMENEHWVALEIDLPSWTCSVYDADPHLFRKEHFMHIIQPLLFIFPEFLKRTGCCKRYGDSVDRCFKLNRVEGLSRNVNGGSCGLFMVKYIEFLVSGRTDFEMICDEYVAAYREQISYNIFSRKWNWKFI